MCNRCMLGLAVVAMLIAGVPRAIATDSPFDNDSPVGIPRPPDLSAPVQTNVRPKPKAAEEPVSANPLWGIPLKALSVTRSRPLFRPSRRPPAAVVAAPVHETVKSAPPPAAPERPQLRLVGVVAGASDDGFAVFISSTTHDIIPLKTGEGHGGWILRSVKRREAVLEKGQQTVVIKLPQAMGTQK